MPSDDVAASNGNEPVAASAWDWLSSQGLGVICGQATVFLLAVGSVVIASTREGASAMIQMDDIRAFFAPPSVVHLWFYVLIFVLALYGLNTLLATWKSVSLKWRGGMRQPQAYAPAIVHIGFLLALFAHLVGGLGSSELEQVILGPEWKALGNGSEARLAALDVAELPDGSTKQVAASVALRDDDGKESTATVHYNGPLSWGFGSELFLLVRQGTIPLAVLRRGTERCALQPEASCFLGETKATLIYLHPPSRRGDSTLARVQLQTHPEKSPSELWLTAGVPTALPDGSALLFEGLESRSAILLRHRRAPGNPWALLSTVVMAIGLALMWRRFT